MNQAIAIGKIFKSARHLLRAGNHGTLRPSLRTLAEFHHLAAAVLPVIQVASRRDDSLVMISVAETIDAAARNDEGAVVVGRRVWQGVHPGVARLGVLSEHSRICASDAATGMRAAEHHHRAIDGV